MKHARARQAFTFVEVFVALVFLAILVPAIVEALQIASRASVLAERGAVASELAENKLNEQLIENTQQNTSQTKGDFGTDYPGYTWQMTQQQWDQDNINTMTQVSVQVFYPVQGVQRSVTLTTLISGSTQSVSTQSSQ
jgi:hypothetical protein